MKKGTLIIAPSGMLGRATLALVRSRGELLDALDIDRLDITDSKSVSRAVTRDVGVVINCAAWTDVDGAETNEASANAVNATGVGNLLDACERVGALLVTYGTDYVFPGQSRRPYAVDDRREPINAYGRSKARGEELMEACKAEWLHIRTSWLYAPWGKNFVRTIEAASRTKPELRVVDDQRGRPTSAEHLARVTLALIERGARGHWHATDGGDCTWFEFARETVRLAGNAGRCKVSPCTSAEFPRPAKRPAYSVLDITRTEALLGPMPGWRENLADVVRRLEP